MALRLFAKISVPAVSINRLRQGRFFSLWTLWKIRPEFHTRKPLVQNSKRAFYPQTPQALRIKKPYISKYFPAIITDEKTSRPPAKFPDTPASISHAQKRRFSALTPKTAERRQGVAKPNSKTETDELVGLVLFLDENFGVNVGSAHLYNFFEIVHTDKHCCVFCSKGVGVEGACS
jgi:hypothetical protein